MTYLIVNDGNLSGAHGALVPALRQTLGGPLKITVEHMGGLGSLGASPGDDLSERAEIAAAVQVLFQEYQLILQQGIDALALGQPSSLIATTFLSRLSRQQQRDQLIAAQNELDRHASIVLDVVNDLSIPVATVARRVVDFAEGYRANLEGQLSAAAVGLWDGLWDNFLNALESLSRKGVSKAASLFRAGIDEVTKSDPMFIAIGAIAAVGVLAYAWRSIR